MQDLQNAIYCSEQIHIPPSFPYIMKLYCKAAIRTQPYDLLKWSAAYFRALAKGEEPPVKERMEYPPFDSPTGLTPGYIKILIKQLGKDASTYVTAQTLFQKWSDICLDEYLLVKLVALLGANTTINWVKFVGVCAGYISRTLTQTMVLLCELFTEEPEGGSASVPYELFVDLYEFLAKMECGPLSEQEKLQLQGILLEEDVCEVSEKIKQGLYEGEVEGETFYGEAPKVPEEQPAEQREEEEEEEGEVLKPEMSHKESEEKSYRSDRSMRELEVPNEVEEEEKEGEIEGVEESTEVEEEERVGEKSTPKEGSLRSEEGEEQRDRSVSDALSGEPAVGFGRVTIEMERALSETPEVPPPKMGSMFARLSMVSEDQKEQKKMNLEELEESIRERIEEKLAAEAESLDEEEREFEDLGTYVLNAASRVPKFTVEAIGFKIFRKYMRQEVPGIGPTVDAEQVEKVIDFMDVWANKQERMVMPRNIRHWMCPPLERVPTPQP